MSPEDRPFQWIAHRGYPACFPENTRLGFEKAIEAGARLLEADVQMSADRVPVIFHDQTLSRLCGINGVVHRMDKGSLDRISPFDPGRFGTRFKGVRIPSLEELVGLLQRNPEVTLYLEIKHIALTVFGVSDVLDRIMPLIAPVERQVVLISFSVFALKAARKRGWQRVAPVLRRWIELQHPAVRKLEPELVFINHRRLPMGVHYQHPTTKLAFYETSSYRTARGLARRGAAYIETDAIGEMLAAEASAVQSH